MKTTSVAALAVAGAIAASSFVIGAGTASAATFNLSGFCYTNSTQDSLFRYEVTATAAEIVGGSVGGPESFAGYDVNITAGFQVRYTDGYRQSVPNDTSTQFFGSLSNDSICTSIDPSYRFAVGNFVPPR